jgi:hypothetical protein
LWHPAASCRFFEAGQIQTARQVPGIYITHHELFEQPTVAKGVDPVATIDSTPALSAKPLCHMISRNISPQRGTDGSTSMDFRLAAHAGQGFLLVEAPVALPVITVAPVLIVAVVVRFPAQR